MWTSELSLFEYVDGTQSAPLSSQFSFSKLHHLHIMDVAQWRMALFSPIFICACIFTTLRKSTCNALLLQIFYCRVNEPYWRHLDTVPLLLSIWLTRLWVLLTALRPIGFLGAIHQNKHQPGQNELLHFILQSAATPICDIYILIVIFSHVYQVGASWSVLDVCNLLAYAMKSNVALFTFWVVKAHKSDTYLWLQREILYIYDMIYNYSTKIGVKWSYTKKNCYFFIIWVNYI